MCVHYEADGNRPRNILFFSLLKVVYFYFYIYKQLKNTYWTEPEWRDFADPCNK